LRASEHRRRKLSGSNEESYTEGGMTQRPEALSEALRRAWAAKKAAGRFAVVAKKTSRLRKKLSVALKAAISPLAERKSTLADVSKCHL